jgi:uncharacterized membrane protein YhaH (DUF805 family)
VFWGVWFLTTLAFYAAWLALLAILDEDSPLAGPAFLAIIAITLWALIAISAKRWHDLGMSGWWALIGFIPFIGQFVHVIVAGLLRGTRGRNRYGPDPT